MKSDKFFAGTTLLDLIIPEVPPIFLHIHGQKRLSPWEFCLRKHSLHEPHVKWRAVCAKLSGPRLFQLHYSFGKTWAYFHARTAEDITETQTDSLLLRKDLACWSRYERNPCPEHILDHLPGWLEERNVAATGVKQSIDRNFQHPCPPFLFPLPHRAPSPAPHVPDPPYLAPPDRVRAEYLWNLLHHRSSWSLEKEAQLILITGHSPRQQAHVASTKQRKWMCNYNKPSDFQISDSSTYSH